jgi:predicted GH43/DUF377 family glycosyl hydrolase
VPTLLFRAVLLRGDKLIMYYGVADTTAVAIASVKEFLIS